MKILEAVTKTVVVKSIAEQVSDLPLESVIAISDYKKSRYDCKPGTIVHRTGPSGWLTTRDSAGRYKGTKEILQLIQEAVDNGATITVLRKGGQA